MDDDLTYLVPLILFWWVWLAAYLSRAAVERLGGVGRWHSSLGGDAGGGLLRNSASAETIEIGGGIWAGWLRVLFHWLRYRVLDTTG
jgi:hypothetical protein